MMMIARERTANTILVRLLAFEKADVQVLAP